MSNNLAVRCSLEVDNSDQGAAVISWQVQVSHSPEYGIYKVANITEYGVVTLVIAS